MEQEKYVAELEKGEEYMKKMEEEENNDGQKEEVKNDEEIEEENNDGEKEEEEDEDYEDEEEEELDLHYSRDEAVSAITEYYKLLMRFCLPEEVVIKYPPASGWQWPENITFTSPKDATVIDLMKHMPYLKRPWNFTLHIYEKTEAVDYSHFDGPGPHDIDPPLFWTTLPSHALMLGYTHGRDGHYIFVDTKRGTFTLADFQVGPREWSEGDLSVVRFV